MSLIVPIAQEGPHFSFTTELPDGKSYSFEFRWNDRAEAWFMTVGNGEGVPLVSGVRVVVNLPLLAPYSNPELPQGGHLIALDTTEANRDPGFEDLGRRVLLVFFTDEELEAA